MPIEVHPPDYAAKTFAQDPEHRIDSVSPEGEVSLLEEFYLEAGAKAIEYGVDQEDFGKALAMVESLRGCEDGDNTAAHCLAVGLLSAEFAEATGADKGEALIAGMIHDSYKLFINRETLHKSVDGTKGWAPDDREEMAKHAYGGAFLAVQAGFSPRIIYAVAQHHAYQEVGPVENHDKLMVGFPELFPDEQAPEGSNELIAALIDADYTHAMMSRLNSFSDNAAFDKKLDAVRSNLFFVHQTIGLNNPNERAFDAFDIARDNLNLCRKP